MNRGLLSIVIDSQFPARGLRERKKARTRESIQREGLRLFEEQGYAATTCEQIASAAGVAPATLFRYFPTKEDVVLYDVYDPLIAEAVSARPAAEDSVTAVRRAMADLLAELDESEMEPVRQRTALILSVPALRSRTYEQQASLVHHLGRAMVVRCGVAPDNLEVAVTATVTAAALGLAVERWSALGGPLAEHVDAVLAAVATIGQAANQ